MESESTAGGEPGASVHAAAASATALQELAELWLSERRFGRWLERRQLREELTLLNKGLRDAVLHVALLEGYRRGFEARSAARERLEARVPEPDRSRSPQSQLEAIRDAASLLASELTTLSTTEHWTPPKGVTAPTKPGPSRTADRAARHLAGLSSRLGLLRDRFRR